MHKPSRRKFLALGGLAVGTYCLDSALPCQAAPTWTDRQTYGPFQLHATYPLANYAPLFEELSTLEMELQRTLAMPPAQQSVDLFLLDSQKQHRELLSQIYPRVPYRRALYVQRHGRGQVYAYRHPDLAIDLRHECTHALLHCNLPMVPLWLDEGLAEYFEMPESSRPFDHPHLSKLRWNLRLGMVRSIESLEDITELTEMGGVEYRFAWAWVHFFLHGPVAAHRALVHYLAAIRRSSPPGQLSHRMHVELPQLQAQMVQHFKHWRRHQG